MTEHYIVVPKTWRSELRCFAAFILLGGLGIYLSALLPGSIVRGDLFTIFGYQISMSLPLFWLMPLIALGIAIFRIYDVRFAVDSRGVHCTVGIMNIYQRTTSIRYEDVRGITLEQTIIERSLGIGRLLIGTAATGESEILFDGIAVPEEVQAMITSEREKRQRAARRSMQQIESAPSNQGVAAA